MNRSDVKLLLLQIRDHANVREEEHASFARFCGLDKSQIDILNVFDTPDFRPDVINGYDGLLVGGASEASVLERDKYAFLLPAETLLLTCVEQSLPVFASCFGFQLAVMALGGEIMLDGDDFEMGTCAISLAPEASHDPIFRGVSDGFLAVSVHQQKATHLPANCQLLAYTDACVHSFRVIDKPFWTFQFHPEVDRATLVERLTHYKTHYTRDDSHLEHVLSSAKETPESNDLMRSFVDRVILKGER